MRWLLSFCIVGLLAQQAIGQVTDFSWTPASPVIGNVVSFSPVGGPPPSYTASAKWEFRYAATQPNYGGVHAPMNWSLGSDFSMTLPWQCYINCPGDWEVRLTVAYTPMMPPGNPLPNSVIVKTVSAVPPDNVVVVSGMNSPVQFNQQITLQYQVRRGTTPIGITAEGYGELRFEQRWQLSPPFSPPNPDPWPSGGQWWGGDGVSFYRLGCYLFEIRSLTQTILDEMPGISVGAAFYGDTLALRWTFVTPYDECFSASLGSVAREFYKHDATKWGVREP